MRGRGPCPRPCLHEGACRPHLEACRGLQSPARLRGHRASGVPFSRFPLLLILVYTYTRRLQAGIWESFRPYGCGPQGSDLRAARERKRRLPGAIRFYHGGACGAAWPAKSSRSASVSLSSPAFGGPHGRHRPDARIRYLRHEGHDLDPRCPRPLPYRVRRFPAGLTPRGASGSA